jgi:hypothetical protein
MNISVLWDLTLCKKLSQDLIKPHVMKAYGRVKVKLHTSWPRHQLYAPGKTASGSWMNPKGGLDSILAELCSPIKGNRCFGGAYCLRRKGRSLSQLRNW